MDETKTAVTSARSQAGYVLFVLTIIISATVMVDAATGGTIKPYRIALIVTFFCLTINALITDAKGKRWIIGVGMVFALIAIVDELRTFF